MSTNQGVVLLKEPDGNSMYVIFVDNSDEARQAAESHLQQYFPDCHGFFERDGKHIYTLSILDFHVPPDIGGIWPGALFIPGIVRDERQMLLFINQHPRGTYAAYPATSIEECVQNLERIFGEGDIDIVYHDGSGVASFVRRHNRIAVAVKHNARV